MIEDSLSLLDNIHFKVKCLNRLFLGSCHIEKDALALRLNLLHDPSYKSKPSYTCNISQNELKLFKQSSISTHELTWLSFFQILRDAFLKGQALVTLSEKGDIASFNLSNDEPFVSVSLELKETHDTPEMALENVFLLVDIVNEQQRWIASLKQRGSSQSPSNSQENENILVVSNKKNMKTQIKKPKGGLINPRNKRHEPRMTRIGE